MVLIFRGFKRRQAICQQGIDRLFLIHLEGLVVQPFCLIRLNHFFFHVVAHFNGTLVIAREDLNS